MELTTVKASKETVQRLHGAKGFLDHTHPKKKHTLEDALKFLIGDFEKNYPKNKSPEGFNLEKEVDKKIYFPHVGRYKKHSFIYHPETYEEAKKIYDRMIKSFDNKDLQGLFNSAVSLIPDEMEGMKKKGD